MCKCKAYLELSGQSYISRANFALFFPHLTATALFPSAFSVFCPGVPSASMQRPLISRAQTRDGALGEGPGSEYFSMYMNGLMVRSAKTVYKLQQNACGAFE